MPELRSTPGSNRWHIIRNDKSLCGLMRNATLTTTIPDEEFTTIAQTNHTICGRCLLCQPELKIKREPKPRQPKPPREPKPKLHFRTFRVFPEDAKLLRALFGRRNPNYKATVDEFTQLLKQLEVPPKEPLHPLRVGVPVAVATAIEKRHEITHEPRQNILIQAAREYRQEHPLPPMTGICQYCGERQISRDTYDCGTTTNKRSTNCYELERTQLLNKLQQLTATEQQPCPTTTSNKSPTSSTTTPTTGPDSSKPATTPSNPATT